MAKMREQYVVRKRAKRRRWKLGNIALAVALVVILMPFLFEALAMLVAQWAEVTGVRFAAQTPLLTWSGSKLDDCRLFIDDWMSYQFQDASWEPGFALPIMALLIVIAMLMMRR